jgi:hypothetical protein
VKIKYRRRETSDYTTRAARAAAKKVVLAMLADVIRDSATCGYESCAVDAETFAERTSHWTNPRWRDGARKQMDAAAMELLEEFKRRSGGV